MGKRLDPRARGILEFRPNISFAEPEVQAGEITGLDAVQLEDVEDTRQSLKKLAKAVNVLATAIQAKADVKAKNMVVTLDPNVDVDTVAAMARKFPDADPTRITYQQYKIASDGIKSLGEEIGRQALITPEEVAAVRDDADLAQQNKVSAIISQMGGFGTPEARDGSLRPERQERNQIIKPLDINAIQQDLECVLVNNIWEKFMFPAFQLAGIPYPISITIADLLPSKLCRSEKPLPKFSSTGNNGDTAPNIPAQNEQDKAGSLTSEGT